MIFTYKVSEEQLKVITRQQSTQKRWNEEKENVENKGLWKILNLLIKTSLICGKSEPSKIKEVHNPNLQQTTTKMMK